MNSPVPFNTNQGDKSTCRLLWKHSKPELGYNSDVLAEIANLNSDVGVYKVFIILLADGVNNLEKVTTSLIINNDLAYTSMGSSQRVVSLSGHERKVYILDSGLRFSTSTGDDITVTNSDGSEITYSGATYTAIPIRIYGIR